MPEVPLRNTQLVHHVHDFFTFRVDLIRKIILILGFSGYLIYFLVILPSLMVGIVFVILWSLLFLANITLGLKNHSATKPAGIPIVTYYGITLPYQDGLKSRVNTILIHDSVTNRLITQCGVKLTLTTLTTQPNYQDVMRKIYELLEKFAITVQIRMSREGHSHMQEQSYCILLEKHATPLRFQKLCKEMVLSFHDLFAILQVNFIHYKFEPLTDDKLISAIFRPMGVSPTDVQIIQPTLKGMLHVCSKGHLIMLVMNTCGLPVCLFLILPNGFVWIWIGILMGYSLFLIGNDFVFLIHYDLLSVIDIWGQNHPITKKIPSPTSVIFTSRSKYYHFSQQFGLTQFNQSFHFNPTKFYRNFLFEYFNHERNPECDFDICIQFHCTRILPVQLESFQEDFVPDFLEKFFSNPRTQAYYERNQAGFWQTFITFQFTQHFPAPVTEDYLSIEALPIFQQKVSLFQRLLGLHFPTCYPIPEPKLSSFQLVGSFPHIWKTLIPTFFTTGVLWSHFWEIPPEIHKQLVSQYAGEFSTPLLNDEITFGRTMNFENSSLECRAGIAMDELSQNILLAGETEREFLPALNMMTYSILTSYSLQPHMMWFLFDLNHDLKPLIQLLMLSPLGSHIRYFEVGKNFALDLFQLPLKLGGAYLLTYYRKLVLLFEKVFDLPHNESGFFQSILNNSLEDTPTLTTIKEKIHHANNSQDAQSYRMTLYAILSFLDQDIFKAMMSASWAESIDFFALDADSPQIFVFDLHILPTLQIKRFFLLTLYLQLQITMTLPQFESIKRSYIFPQVDLFKAVEQDCLLDYSDHSMFVASSARLADLSSDLLQAFRTYYIFRLQHEKAIKVAGQILHLDAHFTNIYAHNRRSSSYQYQVLGALKPNQCLIKRPAHAFPFPFQVDTLPVIPQVQGKDLKMEIEEPLIPQAPPIPLAETPLELDFGNDSLKVEKFTALLSNWGNLLKDSHYLSEIQMVEDIRHIFEKHFNEYKTPTGKRVEFSRDRFQELLVCKYLQPKTEKKSITEIGGGYTITEKAKEALAQQKEKANPTPTLPVNEPEPPEHRDQPEPSDLPVSESTDSEPVETIKLAPIMIPTSPIPMDTSPRVEIPRKSEFKTALETALFSTYPLFRNGEIQSAYTHLRTQFETIETHYTPLLETDTRLSKDFTRNFHILISIESSATTDFPKMFPMIQDYVAAI